MLINLFKMCLTYKENNHTLTNLMLLVLMILMMVFVVSIIPPDLISDTFKDTTMFLTIMQRYKREKILKQLLTGADP